MAKVHKPHLDIRKPYTEIGTEDCYSGRTYDEEYIQAFRNKYNLPLNPTTAFLTPAFRTYNQPLFETAKISGRPKSVYYDLIGVLQDIQAEVHPPEDYLKEVLRLLVKLRNEQQEAIRQRVERLAQRGELNLQLTIDLLSRHLRMPRASRLPVLVVAAVYDTAQEALGKRYTRLNPHTAADRPSDALGDIEIELLTEQRLLIVYEIKNRTLMQNDIDRAIEKLASRDTLPAEYAFVCTKPIPQEVRAYVAAVNARRIGFEIQAYDCLEFVRHFLHLFREQSKKFLEKYRDLVLAEPLSAVNQKLKEKLLELLETAYGV